ncbi:MAG: oxygen-independent coproporphyrinogen III oxidase [Flavobacteriales bacterium]|nr:oxygen-independent coproporphyrinogen III oxidase [Flavobacteriales bacterium]
MELDLIRKYNVQGPRYTSYPAVPHWKNNISESQWVDRVSTVFRASNKAHGISVYIHLPYCESLCTYCGCNTRITVNHAVERPYILGVLAEWHAYIQLFGDERPVIAELHLGGGTPTFFSPENLQFLISELLAPCDVAPQAEFGFEGHPNNTTFEHLRVLRNLGFTRLSLGIQDFDPVVQKAINRMQSVEQVQTVVDEARALGYESINFDIIFGLPFQQQSSIKTTLEATFRMKPDRIAFYGYAHVPWKHAGQRRYTDNDLPKGPEKRALYELGKAMLEDQGYSELGMDHFALPHDSLFIAANSGRMHRNFMGYTTQSTQLLIGLGCSAISDSGDAYIQNKKVVEDYLESVQGGAFPFFTGHLLSQEECGMRQMVKDIMCHFHGNTTTVGWSAADARERLSEFIQDGILTLQDTEISVTETGRPFVRNICMAMDPHLQSAAEAANRFSTVV